MLKALINFALAIALALLLAWTGLQSSSGPSEAQALADVAAQVAAADAEDARFAAGLAEVQP